jgi:RimJ/RimL family protein N-acetyltransferase
VKAVWTSFGDRLTGQLVAWATRRIWGSSRFLGPASAMAVMDGDQLVAVMVYHNFHREEGVVEISGAADRKDWLKRHILWEMFSYPFDALGCQAVVMRVDSRNGSGLRGIQRILRAYGFTEHRLPHMRGKGRDELVFILGIDEWRANGFHHPTDIAKNTGQSLEIA